MVAPKNSLTEESFDHELWKWKDVVSNLDGLFYEARSYLTDSKPKAVVAAYQEAFQGIKFYEGKRKPYQEELDKILTILPGDRMRRYRELKERVLREGESTEAFGKLADLRNSLDRAEWEAHPRVDQLLSLMHELETVLSLYGEHLSWVRIVALDRAIPLPEEDQTASQVAADQPRAVAAPSSTVRNEKQRKPREEPNLRKHHVQAFAESNPGTKGKNLNQLTCADLDSYRLEFPERWKRKFGVESWSEGYKNEKVRALIASMFSKYRNEG